MTPRPTSMPLAPECRTEATSIVYLASDAAAFVTGTALVIDGGLTAA